MKKNSAYGCVMVQGKTFDTNLVVCDNFSGDSSSESSSLEGFLQIELPPIIAVFASLIQNLVNCPHRQRLAAISVAH
jgi:hypothetical protein